MTELLEIIKKQSIQQEKKIGIGLGDNIETNQRIIQAAIRFESQIKGKIIFVGQRESISQVKEIFNLSRDKFQLVSTSEPEQFLIEKILLNNSRENKNESDISSFDAIIRGGLSSSNFIKIIRTLSKKIQSAPRERSETENKNNIITQKTYRLALLETHNHQQFFYAPVGIDEANSEEDKLDLLEKTIEFLKKSNIPIQISLLSGGRKGDVGRDLEIDQNIQSTERVHTQIVKKHPDLDIRHDYILIENAIKEKSSVIIAPEGISGNLIYRTLVHLGGGKAYGAVYLNIYNQLNKLIIDTSRAAEQSEYEGAIKLALYVR